MARRNDLDVWLSPRVLTESLFKQLDMNEALLSSDFLKKYNYFCELRVKTDGNIEKFKELFERNNVLVEVIIPDLENHFENVYKRDKRQDNEDDSSRNLTLRQLSNKVINKYAATFDVSCFTFSSLLFPSKKSKTSI